MPFLQERVPTFEAYSGMSVEEIYGQSLRTAAVLEANTFHSTVFTFRNGKFEAEPMTAKPDWRPRLASALAIGWRWRRGCFLSQTSSPSPPMNRVVTRGGCLVSRQWSGTIDSCAGPGSGIKVYGEQRGCALGDFDADGRVDLRLRRMGMRSSFSGMLAPNRACAFAERPGRQSWRRGRAAAFGECAWERSGRGNQVGSGYWSQNSLVQVVTLPGSEEPSAVSVRWPGGKTRTIPIPKGAKEIEIDIEGSVRVLH